MVTEIKKLLKVGDIVYSAVDGHEMKVEKIYVRGFVADNIYFHEVRTRYYLTNLGYKSNGGAANVV